MATRIRKITMFCRATPSVSDMFNSVKFVVEDWGEESDPKHPFDDDAHDFADLGLTHGQADAGQWTIPNWWVFTESHPDFERSLKEHPGNYCTIVEKRRT